MQNHYRYTIDVWEQSNSEFITLACKVNHRVLSDINRTKQIELAGVATSPLRHLGRPPPSHWRHANSSFNWGYIITQSNLRINILLHIPIAINLVFSYTQHFVRYHWREMEPLMFLRNSIRNLRVNGQIENRNMAKLGMAKLLQNQFMIW